MSLLSRLYTSDGSPIFTSDGSPVYVLTAADPTRLTQLPLEVAYDYKVLQPSLNAAALLWATPPPPES